MLYINKRQHNTNFSKNEVDFINNFNSLEEAVNYCNGQIAMFSELKNKIESSENFAGIEMTPGCLGTPFGGAMAGGLLGSMSSSFLARSVDPSLNSPYIPIAGGVIGAGIGGLSGYFLGKSREKAENLIKKYPGLKKKLGKGRLDKATPEEREAFINAIGAN